MDKECPKHWAEIENMNKPKKDINPDKVELEEDIRKLKEVVKWQSEAILNLSKNSVCINKNLLSVSEQVGSLACSQLEQQKQIGSLVSGKKKGWLSWL